jgi:hypothetical protein
VITTGGNAIGEYSDVDYTDPTAILTGTWGADQMGEATAYCANPSLVYGQDIEIRLRSSVTGHSNTGYEVFWGCRTGSTAFAWVVRWNGKKGDFTVLQRRTGSDYGVVTGDKIKAIVIGDRIKGYINDVEVLMVVDSTPITSGNPGIGFNANVGTTNVDFGFQDFTATDEMVIVVGPTATGNGDGSDWNNIKAISTLTPSGWVRGNIYYLAKGSYGSANFETAESGSLSIAIKKATAADHGPNAGWLDPYGDEQAINTGMSVTTDYWTISVLLLIIALLIWLFYRAFTRWRLII